MKIASFDKELDAAKIILHALESFDVEQRRFVLKTVTDRLGLPPAQDYNPGKGGAPAAEDRTQLGTTQVVSNEGPLNGQTAKQFLKSKSPKQDGLRIACLAYYLTHVKNQPHFKTLDLTKLNTEAAGTKLSNPSMAVSNATTQNNFLAPVGKGNKQITALGEEVVEALPDEEAVKNIMANQKKPRRKNRIKAGQKAK
jgi:hypothetical protein